MLKFNSFPKRHVAGKKAQRNGEMWENLVLNAARKQCITIVRIPNGCVTRGGRIIRVKSPFDWVLSLPGMKACFIDTKLTKTPNFAYSLVTEHQVRELLDLEKDGHLAGYLVLFSTLNKVTFFRASQLASIKMRESLKPEDGLNLGVFDSFDLKKIFELPQKG